MHQGYLFYSFPETPCHPSREWQSLLTLELFSNAFHQSDDIQEGDHQWHAYLVPGSITLVMFPISIKCIWFPAEGELAGRTEMRQPHQGQEGSLRKHHSGWCAWKRMKSGNAYTIREKT